MLTSSHDDYDEADGKSHRCNKATPNKYQEKNECPIFRSSCRQKVEWEPSVSLWSDAMSARLASMTGSSKDGEQAWVAMNTMEQSSSVSVWVNAHHETPRFNLTNMRQRLKHSSLHVTDCSTHPPPHTFLCASFIQRSQALVAHYSLITRLWELEEKREGYNSTGRFLHFICETLLNSRC